MGTAVKLYYVDRNSTYKEWELIPNKFLVVDSIADYLATKSAYTISNFQYIKNELEIGINVDLSQSYAQPKSATNFKYVSIQNADELTHYYFVKKVIWRSKTAVRFELVMDVLNTLQEGYDYEWKENTRIIREHKDRFIYEGVNIRLYYGVLIRSIGSIAIGDEVDITSSDSLAIPVYSGTIVSSGDDYITIHFASIDKEAFKNWLASTQAGGNGIGFVKDEDNYKIYGLMGIAYYGSRCYRNIDFISEGINPILIRKFAGKSIINDSSILNQDWYLLYRNQDDPSDSLVNPVECYLIPQNQTNTDSAYITGGRLIPSWLEEGKYYFFVIGTNSATLSNGVSVSYSSGYIRQLMITKAGNKINVIYLELDEDTGITTMKWQYDDISYIDFSPMLYPVKYNVFNTCPVIPDELPMSWPYDFTNREGYSKLDSITELDKTDAKNIKLIKLPYCPYSFTISGTALEVEGSSVWEYGSITQANGGVIHALRLINLNTKLEKNISANSLNPFKKLYVGDLTYINTDLRKPITDELESKLFHSDFYSPNYVYDSFTMRIELERCYISDYMDYGVDTNTIKFTMTSTINSKFLFSFTSYILDKSESNFDNVMPIARNNEVVLYNVPYINYIRTGFNYDVKAKNIQTAANVMGLVGSVASIGASLLAPSVPLKVAGVVASIVSMANAIKTTIVSAINSENAIKQKIEQTKNQAASVVGSEDVDLMSEYSSNRLWYMLYMPTDIMRNLLNDLFFYAGYSSNRMGLPNHNTRINFDYLECEASIQAIASIPEECLTELINCFKAGVTYIHKTNRDTNKWDFAQKYENYENALKEN